jgi:hypothetical protein
VRSLALTLLALAAPLVVQAEPAVKRQTEQEPFALLDADTVGDHRLAFGFGAGFPYVQAMAAYNVLDGLDADLNVDSLYGVATQVSLGPKLRMVRGDGVAFALEVQGQYCWFRTPASQESQGARYITGLRNLGLQPQALLSYKARYGSLFATAFYQGTFDLEPVSQGPLTGNPGSWSYGSNLGFHLGGELAPGGLIHAYGIVGLDFHLRSGDFPVLPVIELGFSFPG